MGLLPSNLGLSALGQHSRLQAWSRLVKQSLGHCTVLSLPPDKSSLISYCPGAVILTRFPEPGEGHGTGRGPGSRQVWIDLALYWASVEDFIVGSGERCNAELKTLG